MIPAHSHVRAWAKGILGKRLWTRLSVAKKLVEGTEPELRVIQRLLVPRCRVALDVGANHGIYTRALSLWADSVVAFEPIDWLARALQNTSLSNVTVECVALGRSEGSAELRIPSVGGHRVDGLATISPRNTLSSNNPDLISSIPVECTTLDLYVQRTTLRNVDFIKIDVEGFEQEVLEGGIELIRRDRPKLFVEIETRHGADPRAVFDFLYGLRYSGFRLVDGQLDTISPKQVEALQRLERSGPQRYPNGFFFLPS